MARKKSITTELSVGLEDIDAATLKFACANTGLPESLMGRLAIKQWLNGNNWYEKAAQFYSAQAVTRANAPKV